MFIKHGIINVIIIWYKIIITSTTNAIRASSLRPTKNLKQLKNLFNMLSPNIKYSNIFILCLTFVCI